jgi:hypothetical protein
MVKRDMKRALGASLKAEEKAVKDRFTKAESVLSKRIPAPLKEDSVNGSKGKVIRDSFTIPTNEYELITRIKKRCMRAGVSANKSEILRAGLAVLEAIPDKELANVFENLARVKTGRPSVKK